jgi:hypothetical protein
LAIPAGERKLARSRGAARRRLAIGARLTKPPYTEYNPLMQRREFLIAGGALAAAPLGLPQTPAKPIRSIQRLFVSEVEDKPWFYDREMWPRYLDMLAENRFNRFNLSFGIGYDFLRQVTDAYFLFTYPFLLDVPGYKVRAANLPDAERARNLETLRYISEQTASRGLEFQLGLWMHGYVWENSPNPNYTIEGLTAESHGPYSRDALAALLKALPKVTGVNLRVHGESGVNEGSYDFWKTVFDGVKLAGRKLEMDLHSKGIDQKMIDMALATGNPVKVSPKFWAEHLGLPYHQADIRPNEIPIPGRRDQGLMAMSAGSRSFTRYGYADLLREDRKFDILWRIWPGTQRLLPWHDSVFAAAYERAFQFCGSAGFEWMEPLSFKGRRGSGLKGNRTGLLKGPKWDWEYYRTRATKPDPSSRILPLITTAHCPSAANNNYWPEMYTNQPIVDGVRHHYSDTPTPRTFGNTAPLDPQLFSRINDFPARSGKYSPLEVAQWLEDLAAKSRPMEAAIGRFFASKFRSGVLYRIFESTGDRAALEAALKTYKAARATWSEMANRAKDVYVADVTVGEHPWLRGHWLDRLPAIDEDIAAMEKRLATATANGKAAALIAEALGRPARPSLPVRHTAPARFEPKQPLTLKATCDASGILHYRHVNQAERWKSAPLESSAATIPADYTDSPYPLQYYFEFRTAPDKAFLYPGLGPDLANQPYFVLRYKG